MPKCRKCSAEIEWVKTNSGKSMPVDAETYHGEAYYDVNKHMSHFATCPNADDFRAEATQKTNQVEENRKEITILKLRLEKIEKRIGTAL